MGAPEWLNDLAPSLSTGLPACNFLLPPLPPFFFRLVWARAAAEIQGDGEDIRQH